MDDVVIEYLYQAEDAPEHLESLDAECFSCGHALACHLPGIAEDAPVPYDVEELEITSFSILEDKTVIICRTGEVFEGAERILERGPCAIRGCNCRMFTERICP